VTIEESKQEESKPLFAIIFSNKIVISSLRRYYSVGVGNVSGVVINDRELH
jgi:hypothetical protein